MRIFRLCERRYSAAVLSGEGGLEFDGRWHTRGHRIVYCASSEALAVLEIRVHAGRFIDRALFVMHEIDVPDEKIESLAKKQLPKQWRQVSPSKKTQALGDAWLEKKHSLALKVPSIHSRSDWNILLNPEHDAVRKIKVVSRYPYSFDPRLF